MFNMAVTFVQSVLTFYAFYRYVLQQNDYFGAISIAYVQWLLFYLTWTLLVIHISTRVTREVENIYRISSTST